MKAHDLTGRRFGRWTVARLLAGTPRRWLVRCDCGNTGETTTGSLNFGHSKSCGCLQRDTATTHGFAGSNLRLYQIWKGMLKRCENKNSTGYARYGAVGITVSQEWHDVAVFMADMGATYRPGLSIDRIDTNKGYSKENCRWATKSEQSRNQKSNVWLDTPWGRLLQVDAAKKAGLPNYLLSRRRLRGVTGDLLFCKNPRTRKTKSIKVWPK